MLFNAGCMILGVGYFRDLSFIEFLKKNYYVSFSDCVWVKFNFIYLFISNNHQSNYLLRT